MDRSSIYYRQVQLLVSLIPLIAEEDCFALKGGTAINLFVRDLPRLSVDIDLVYLPMDERTTALTNITQALGRISSLIKTTFVDAGVVEVYRDKPDALRLVVSRGDVQVKVELSPVLRGTVFEPEVRSVSEAVEDEFGYAEIAVLAMADLYAGKICAALDRQHPRDLFDVRWLLDHEGINDEIRKALLVYLISHPRPIAELIDPVFSDLETAYVGEFAQMTDVGVPLAALLATREQLVGMVRSGFSKDDREFLLSFKARNPRWELLDLPHVEQLPAVRWKMMNLEKMSVAKHQASYQKLQGLLGK
ncbi:MAG: nucleotidyl transferase AbiEii/AbiGii toxin family protein [Candidatus Sedimenticola sp. 6PFRAG7]